MHTVYIIDDDENLKNKLNEEFKKDDNYKFKQIRTEEIDVALKDIPALIIVNEDTISEKATEVCHKIRNNDDNSITPVIVVTSEYEREHKLEILKAAATYYIKNPLDYEYLYYTITNIINLLYINRKVSPLTNLPGNVQIQAEMKKRLLKKQFFVMLYIDLDNFKAYNDVYGFSNGDEIIKFTARTISRNVHSKCEDNNFVGHIGGDDFIAIVPTLDVDNICQLIIANFDEGVTKFFTEEDLEKGYIEVANRKGIIEQFSLTSISIGAVIADKDRFANILEIGEIGAQVKHVAKSIIGSSYAVDRRHE